MLEVAVDDGVGGTVNERENCGRGIGGSVLWKRGAAKDEQVWQLPVLKIGRDHRMSGRISRTK